jgi:hypothetical protein
MSATQLEHYATLFYAKDRDGNFIRDVRMAKAIFLMKRISRSSTEEVRQIYADELLATYNVDSRTGLPDSVPFVPKDGIRIWHGFNLAGPLLYDQPPFSQIENRAWSMRFAAALGTFQQFASYFDYFKGGLSADELEDLVYDMRFWHEHVERVIPQYIKENFSGFLSFYATCILPDSTAVAGEMPTTHERPDTVHELRRHHTNTDAWIAGARRFFYEAETRRRRHEEEEKEEEEISPWEDEKISSWEAVQQRLLALLPRETFEPFVQEDWDWDVDYEEQLNKVLTALADGSHATSTHLKWLDFFMEAGMWEHIPQAFFSHHHAAAVCERICMRAVTEYREEWEAEGNKGLRQIVLDTIYKGDHIHILDKEGHWDLFFFTAPRAGDVLPEYFRLFLDVAELRCIDGTFPRKCFAKVVKSARLLEKNPLADPQAPVWKELALLVPANELVSCCL